MNRSFAGGAGAPAGHYDPAVHTTFKAWSFDYAYAAQTTLTTTTGRPTYSLIPVPTGFTANSVTFVLATAGTATTWTSGQNLLGLYDAAGALLGQTADLSVTLGAAGASSIITANLTAPVAVPSGKVYGVFLFNWTAGTVPTVLAVRGLGTATQNIGAPTTAPRSAYDAITRTALVASKAPNLLSLGQGQAFMAIA